MYSVTEEVVAWLAGLGYRASTRVPKGAPRDPSEFATAERVGGRVADMVDHATFAVQTWAATEERAEEMANEVRMAALTGPLPRGVRSMRVSAGPYAFYDQNTLCSRYQTVYELATQLTD